MTDLQVTFDLSNTPGYSCITAHTVDEYNEVCDDIGAGLIAAGCKHNEVTVNWWPNAPNRRKQFVVNGVIRYEVVLIAPKAD